LGLSVSFGIVKRYHGDITVESEVGRGSTFTVRFPAEAGATAPRSTAAAAPPVPVARSLRVLVVEDEEGIRRFLAMGLTQLGHQVRLAADGTAGLEALAQERFDVVLTDLGLPGVSGEEVARAVAEQCPGTPVLVMTGWGDQLKAKGQTLPGVAQVLSKPFQLQTLADALRQVCRDPAPPAAADSLGQVA
jgi:CheY-like chemotaxis protein